MASYTSADASQPQNLDPLQSVFVNCPFDPDFSLRFDALIYTIVCCGLDTAERSGNRERGGVAL